MRLFAINTLAGATLVLMTNATCTRADGPPPVAKRPPAKQIEFSEPATTNSMVTTNRLQPNTGETTLGQIQKDIFRPLDSFIPDHPLDPVMAIPPPQQSAPVPNKRAMDRLQKRKNWALTNPDEAGAEASMGELLGITEFGIDGREKPETSSMEQLYQGLGKGRGMTTKQVSEALGALQSSGAVSTNNFNPLGFAFSGTNYHFRDLGSPLENQAEPEESVFRPVFERAVGASQPTAAALEEQDRRFQEFQQILNPHLAAGPPSSLTPALDGAFEGRNSDRSRSRSDSGFSSLLKSPALPATPSHVNLANTYSPTDPNLAATHSRAYDNVTAHALGMTNLVSFRPAVVPPKTEFQNPFDPYNKAFKPKF